MKRILIVIGLVIAVSALFYNFGFRSVSQATPIGSGQTRVNLTQVGIPPEMIESSRMGWIQQFDKIEGLLQ